MQNKTCQTKKNSYAISMVIATLTLCSLSLPALASNRDGDIEVAAQKSHVFTNYLEDDAIQVQSKDGAVTLTGSVATKDHKVIAGETVANIPEVKSVDNQLVVKSEQPSEMSDAWLLTKVKTTLLFHRSVSAATEVGVQNGIVTLSGGADNQAQKELTTEYAADIDGVKEVKNDMRMATSSKEQTTLGDKIDDASITAMVKMTLLSHRSTSSFKTSVTTKQGVVTLAGAAKNSAERELAGKLASDVNGVQSVQNQMTVN